MTAFDTYLYYGDADTFTVNATPAESFEQASATAEQLAHAMGADGYAIYDPREDSNEHFPGPCIKTVHSYGVQVHRPEVPNEAGRWALRAR